MKDANCLICGSPLSVRVARGRKSNKPFLMLVCPKDGRHFRAFISDKAYVGKVLEGGLQGSESQKTEGKGTGRGRPQQGKP